MSGFVDVIGRVACGVAGLPCVVCPLASALHAFVCSCLYIFSVHVFNQFIIFIKMTIQLAL